MSERLSERQLRIIETARGHDGRFLLPTRFRGPSWPPREQDLDYDACDALVLNSYADWLQGSLAPGIRLTRKADQEIE